MLNTKYKPDVLNPPYIHLLIIVTITNTPKQCNELLILFAESFGNSFFFCLNCLIILKNLVIQAIYISILSPA